MNLDMINEMWKEDCKIPTLSLDEVSRQTPALHAKYLELRSVAKLQLKKAQADQKILLKDKWLYYNGKMDQDEIQKRGWDFDPFDGLKVLKGDMDYYYESDEDIRKSQAKIEYYEIMVETLEDIVSNINWRHQTIGNMIRWRMFEAGN